MMPYLIARPLSLAAALLLAAPGPASQPSDELHSAPEPARGNAPNEAELSPPADAEKVAEPPASVLVEVRNPAFPGPVVHAKAPAVDPGKAYSLEDLEPYFGQGALAEAKALFDRGAYADARRKLADETSLPARYLAALAAVRGGLSQPAAEEMRALATDYPALRDRCLTHAGVAYESLKKWDAAAELLAQVSSDSRTWADARLALFRVLRNAGRLDEAVEAVKPLTSLPAPTWGRDVGAEALVGVAELEKARKRPAAEKDALAAVWALHPLSALAKQAEAKLVPSKLPLDRRVQRAETLIDAHRNRDGIALLEPLLPKLTLPPPPKDGDAAALSDADLLACRAHFAYGKAFRKEREHTRAIAALTAVVERCRDADLRPRALYVLGSSRSIVQVASGAETYEALARDYPAHSFADDALFYAADLHLANGQVEDALARLDEISKRYPEGDFAGEALFKSFWIMRQRGDRAAALGMLDRIEALFRNAPESYELERALYWRARMEEQGGEAKKAANLFFAIAREHPATYYGLIARKRLAQMDPSRIPDLEQELVFPPAGDVWPLHAGPLEKDPHFLTALELYRLGFPDAVTTELLAANRARVPAEAVRLIVYLLKLSGDPRAAHAVARLSLRGDLSGRITARTRSVWEVAYPLAFRDLVERHCKSAGIEPDLLQALMREESALDPKALSWAGALGLTQLMPTTAKAVGRGLKLRNITPKRLLEPELNIQLGSAYLGDLVKRFESTYEYALAGYNAGGGAVSKWRRDRPTLELDEWVEEIPISETRGYVKRVLRSFNTYQLLYPKPKPPVVSSAR